MHLRPLRVQDWRAIHEWARLEESSRYQPWGPNTPEQTRAFVEEGVKAWSARPQTRFVYAALVDAEVKGLGELRLGGHRQVEIAYSVHPGIWGRGMGTQIGLKLLTIGFVELGAHRIWGTCDPRNVGSGRVMAKLGMTHEGRLRQNILIKDGWRDSDLYSILETDWAPG